MGKSENTMASRREAANKAEMAFKVFDKDNDGYITKDEFQKISKKLSKDQVRLYFDKFWHFIQLTCYLFNQNEDSARLICQC